MGHLPLEAIKGLQGHLSKLWAGGVVPPTAIRYLCFSTAIAMGHLKPQQIWMIPQVFFNLNDIFIL